MLRYGDCCKEYCIKRRFHVNRMSRARMLLQYCVNKGCGYLLILKTEVNDERCIPTDGKQQC